MKKIFKILFFFLLTFPFSGTGRLFAQVYPVQVNVYAVPPYSNQLSDYYTTSREKLAVELFNRDLTKPDLDVELKMTVSAGSLTLQNRQGAYYPAITLTPGVLTRLTQDDLAPYMQPQNLAQQGYMNQGKLPDGLVEFTFQAIEKRTRKAVSAPKTARIWLSSQKPPLLNLPANDENMAFTEPLNIRFQWMPQHRNISQVEYEFELRELPANGAAPQSAFLYSPVIYSERLLFTTLMYTAMMPPLDPDRTYGWRVRAIARDGIDELNVFENGGYSEMRFFRTQTDCLSPTGAAATVKDRDIALTWTAGKGNTEYVIEYRNKNATTGEWTGVNAASANAVLRSLPRNATYEYRIGGVCGTGGEPVFSQIGEAAVGARDLSNCGIAPIVEITNREILQELKIGDVVIVGGDFPMTVTKVSGGNGTFSGEGWVPIEWVLEMKLAVEFEGLTVNTDYQMLSSSFVRGKYDTENSQIANLDAFDHGGTVENTRNGVVMQDIEVDFSIPENPQFTYNEETGELKVFDTNGNPQTVPLPKNEGKTVFPVTVKDKDGNLYRVEEEDINIADKGTENETNTPSSNETDYNTQESQTKIEDGDISLYIAIKERTDNKKQDRYYSNNETVILFPNVEYDFEAVREYATVNENGKETIEKISEIKPCVSGTIVSEQLNSRPYRWKIEDKEKKETNKIEHTFTKSGNYTITVNTNNMVNLGRGTVTHKTSGKDVIECKGDITVAGLPELKLNVTVLAPQAVYFTRGDNYKGEYGFDNYEKTELKKEYEILKVSDNIDYLIPFMTVQPNKDYTVFAMVNVTKEYLKAIGKDAAAYTFVSNDGGITVNNLQSYTVPAKSLKEGSNKITLKIRSNTAFGYEIEKSISVKDYTNEKETGRLKLYCANVDKTESVNLVKVYLGDSLPVNNPKTPQQLLNEAVDFMNNKAYNQLFASFRANQSMELTVTDEMIKQFLAEYMPNFGGIEQLFNQNREVKNGQYDVDYASILHFMESDTQFNQWTGKTIIVIANRNKEMDGNSRTSGFAKTSKLTNLGQYVVMYNSGLSDFTTYTHEIGHLLGLLHTFDTYPNIPQGTSQNYMDYSPITNMFWKWQWKILRENIGKPQK